MVLHEILGTPCAFNVERGQTTFVRTLDAGPFPFLLADDAVESSTRVALLAELNRGLERQREFRHPEDATQVHPLIVSLEKVLCQVTLDPKLYALELIVHLFLDVGGYHSWNL